MCPGAWVIANGGRVAISAACGVTPHAQKTGTSPSWTSMGSPKSGLARSLMPLDSESSQAAQAFGIAAGDLGTRMFGVIFAAAALTSVIGCS